MIKLFLTKANPGVISSKYHSKMKVSAQARMRLRLASEQEDFNQREDIFSKHRPELCVEFRSILTILEVISIRSHF